MILKRCTKCRVEKPLKDFSIDKSAKSGYKARCKKCSHEDFRKYYQAHKTKIVKKILEYREKNKEKLLKYESEYRRTHKEDRAIYSREYHNSHKEERLKKNHEFYNNHKEKCNKNAREYYNSHKEERKIAIHKYSKTPNGKLATRRKKHKRRTHEENTETTLTSDQWDKIIFMQNNRCNICHKKFTKKRIPTIDHIIPVSLGGGLTFENIQALCSSCNSRKQAKLDLQFIQTWAYDGTGFICKGTETFILPQLNKVLK